MKNKSVLLILLYFCSIDCNAQLDNIKANEQIKQRMIFAKQNTDAYLIDFFGEHIFNMNLKWNISNSHVHAKYNYTGTSYLDSVTFIPQLYILNYKVYDDSTFISHFSIEADSLGFVTELPTNHFQYDDLIGLKKLLNNTFISKQKAIEIGENYGIISDSIYAELINNRNEVLDNKFNGEKVISYFWEVSITMCKECKAIYIDPITGKIVKELSVFREKE